MIGKSFVKFIPKASISGMTIVGVLTLGAVTDSNAQSAPNMAAFCKGGAAAYPQGVSKMPPVFKFNICWWLEDARISPEEFDIFASELPVPASPFMPAWQAIFDKPARNHLSLAEAAEARLDRSTASAEYKKAAFYLKMNRLPKRPPTADLAATEKAYLLAGAQLERVTIKTSGTEIYGYFKSSTKPSSNSIKSPALVIIGGLDNFKTEMLRHADYFNQQGLATLIIENPSTGENSLPFRPESKLMMDAVAEYLASRRDIDSKKIAIYGWSMGGYLATLAGLSNNAFKAIVNVGGPADVSFGEAHCRAAPGWIVAPYALFANMNPTTTSRDAVCRHYEPYQLSRQITAPTATQLAKPILMINGSLEDLVSTNETSSLSALGYNITSLIYGADGHTAEANMPDHFAFTANWVLKRLGR
jgi:esterase FrsA